MSIEHRAVRYQDLNPCTNAFIDTKSPGSDQKENFTVIGPGVAENPHQHVHIRIPHGFNIGGARQPAGCLNSQHSHLTAEVFVVHTGKWKFISGVNGDDGEVSLDRGDLISIPTNIFRGFECLEGVKEGARDNLGYLHAVLGGDDPGRVLWAPSVFEMAEQYGLILLDNGSLVDTTLGEQIPPNHQPMPVTSAAQIDAHRVVNSAMLETFVIRRSAFTWSNQTSLGRLAGVSEVPLIGGYSPDEGIQMAKLGWKHGFVVRGLKLSQGASIPSHVRFEEEVIFVHQGQIKITVDEQIIQLGVGDHFTTPIGAMRSFENIGKTDLELYVTRRGDLPAAPQFL